MTPRTCIEQVVRPNLAELAADPASVRLAMNAVHAVDALRSDDLAPLHDHLGALDLADLATHEVLVDLATVAATRAILSSLSEQLPIRLDCR